MKLEDLKLNLAKISTLIKQIDRGMDGYTDNIQYNTSSPNERQLASEYETIVDKLFDINHTLEYFTRKVIHTGTLFQKEDGRYWITDMDDYYTSGEGIEYMVIEDYKKIWRTSRVEHNGNDYYIYGDKDVKMEGLTVRVREKKY